MEGTISKTFNSTIELKVSAISYERILFNFAGFKNHINLYPTLRVLKKFEKELKQFKTGKGSIQFSLNEELPKSLIRKIAKFRVKYLKENDSKWM